MMAVRRDKTAAVAPVRPAARGVQSIEIGGRLLAALVRAGQPMMLRELAQATKLTPGQAHAYLVSFRKLEIVEQDAASGRYRLGSFALHLGLARQRTTDALKLAAEAAPELTRKLDLMSVVTVWGTGGATVIHVVEASNQVVINIRPGIVLSVSGTATGRVFAAFLPPGVAEPVIVAEFANPELIERTGGLVDRATLQAEIAAIRGRGYASSVGRRVPGLAAIAAPVFDFTGRIQLAMTLIGQSRALDTSADGAPVAELLRVTATLSAELGSRPEGSE